MKEDQKQLIGPHDVALHCQYWLPDGETPSKIVLLVHGAGEHSGRYGHVAKAFTDNNYAFVAVDLPGHGQSAGPRCFVSSLDDYTESVNRLYQDIRQRFQTTDVVLLGHSMGGLIASLYLLEHQNDIKACILSGPAILTDLQPGWLQLTVIRVLSKVLPKLGVLQLDATDISRDEQEVKKYQQDPLVHNGKMTARLVSELFRGAKIIASQAGSITIPMLMLHGGDDVITSPKGSQFLYDTLASKDKKLKIYQGLYHEIFNEPERQAVFDDMMNWLADKA